MITRSITTDSRWGCTALTTRKTVHHCEDIFDIDPATVCEGRPVGLAHFSPDCKHFSKAKGGTPLDKKIRGLVLVMLRWAKYRARVMTMENVEEITTWGPLKRMKKKGKWGWYADPKHKGRTWLAFLDVLSTGIRANHPDLPEIIEALDGTVTREECIRGFGYAYEARQIRAADFGSPTIRKRLFMVSRCDGCPIVWPEPTHYNAKLSFRPHNKAPWRTIAECIDWTRPCPSIFLTHREAKRQKINCRRPLAEATLRRVAMGIDRYVLRSDTPFLVSVTHQGGVRVEPTDEPARTVTGANRGEKALVAPALSRFNVNTANSKTTGRGPNAWSAEEAARTVTSSPGFAVAEAKVAPFITECANASSQRNMPADEPARTICGEVKGGHLAVVSASIMVNTTGHSGSDVATPAMTATTGEQQALIAGTLVQTGYGEREGQAPRALDVQKPLGTIVDGGKHAVVAATLVHTAHGEADASGKKRGRGAHDIQETMPSVLASSDAAVAILKLSGAPETHPGQPVASPAPAVRAGGEHEAVIAASVVRHFGESIGQAVTTPAPTTVAGGGGKTGLVAAHLTKFNTGSIGQEVSEPITTIPAGSHDPETHGGAATPHGMVAAYLAQHNAGNATNPGHAPTEPASTISTKGSQQQVVAASVAAYFGSERDGQAVDEPARTVSTKPRLAHVESTAVAPMTPEQVAGARQVAAFLRSFGVKFEGEFATVAGYVIVDIGMRMLMPRELFRAQGFGENYVIDRAWVIDPTSGALTEIALTKEQQIRMCGNSVCPQVAAALVRANVPELAVSSQRSLRAELIESGVCA